MVPFVTIPDRTLFPLEQDTTPLGYWFSVMAQRYYTLTLHRMQEFDMDRWFYVLVLIADNDGRMSQQQLAEALMIDKVAMLRAIDTLSEKGYVERISCPNDRRKHHIRMLPKAKPVVKAIKKAYAEVNEQAMGDLTPATRKAFLDVLSTLPARLSIDGLKPAHIHYTKKIPK